MIALLIVLIVLVVIALGVLVFLLFKKPKESIKDNGETNVLKEKLDGMNKLYEDRLNNVNKTIEEVQNNIKDFKDKNTNADQGFLEKLTLANNNLDTLKSSDNKLTEKFDLQHTIINDKINNLDKVIKEIKMSAENSQSVTKAISDQVSNLNNIFVASNKKRGNLGEYILNKLLDDIYGTSNDLWEQQYKMPDGNIVDAIVKTGKDKENIAVDSKFPLDNYNKYVEADNKDDEKNALSNFKKDIKAKINEVKKYINTKNGISSAIMFVPSEELFGLIYREFPDVVDDALKSKVWITSPTTLAALLSLIDRQNSDAKLNKNLDAVKKQLLALKADFVRFSNRWGIVKNYIGKVNGAIKDLDNTQSYIQKRYEKIYDQSELDAISRDESDED